MFNKAQISKGDVLGIASAKPSDRGKTTLSSRVISPLRNLISASMPVAPRSYMGKAMVVSGGSTIRAIGISSIPITLMSSGMAYPSSFNPTIQPTAMISLEAMIAVGLCGRA